MSALTWFLIADIAAQFVVIYLLVVRLLEWRSAAEESARYETELVRWVTGVLPEIVCDETDQQSKIANRIRLSTLEWINKSNRSE